MRHRRRHWFVSGRFRIPFGMRWLSVVPVPRAVRRWYYRLSVQVAGHPSNWHWKMFALECVDCGGGGGDGSPPRRYPGRGLRPGERCLWCGGYRSGQTEENRNG